jgi:drug/metabolite transporter (DMT)-like permease
MHVDTPDPSTGVSQTIRAVLMLFVAILCFDVMAILVRVLSADYSILELSAYRNVLGVIPSLAVMIWAGELRLHGTNLRIRRWRLALMRGLIVAVAQLCFYSAIAFLELATVSALGQTNAFFVVILSIILLGERVGLWRWAGVALGFAGAVLIMRPGTDAFTVYALLPVASAFCYGISMVTVRMFGNEVSTALLYLYSAFGAAVGAIVLAVFTTSFHPIAGLADAGLILSMAVIGGCGVLFLTLAYRMAAPSILATFGYFGILTAFLWGWVFFGESPIEKLFPGVVLIIAAGVLIIWRENVGAGQVRDGQNHR